MQSATARTKNNIMSICQIFTSELLWLHFIASMGTALQMESFVEDMMESVASTRPAILFDPDKESMSKWGHGRRSSALISATGDPEETVMITEHLRYLIKNDDLDSIFVLNLGLNELIKNITESLGILKSKIHLVLPHGDSTGLQPRLDSRLYLYTTTSETDIILYENYKIR